KSELRKEDYMIDFNNQKNVLITGAAGFIGYHLSKKLMETGYKVIGIDNLNDYYDVQLKKVRLNLLKENALFEFHKINIAHKETLMELFKEKRPQLVINLAAQAGVRYSLENPDVYVESNLIGFFNILEC